MIYELKTLIFDIIMAIIFIIEGLFWFDVIYTNLVIKTIVFALCVVGTIYFGCYRNHNYTAAACENQGKLDTKKGKLTSNVNVLHQTLPKKEIKE